MLIGYARVSSKGDRQSLDMQINALTEAGVDPRNIFSDQISGASKTRPGLDKALEHMVKGDTLIVWAFDRLGRDTAHLLQLLDELKARKVHVRFLRQDIDTSTSAGKLFLKIAAIFAEFEREIARERIMAGLESARRKGRVGGRPRAFNPDQERLILAETEKGTPQSQIANMVGATRSTVASCLKRLREAGITAHTHADTDPADQVIDIEELVNVKRS